MSRKISYFCHMISKEVPFIDIHTHSTRIKSGLYSYGIHPWAIQRDELTPEASLLSDRGYGLDVPSEIAAIGETGLDRLHKETFDLQQKVFEQHILLSEQYQKPLIIHNVKATANILNLHKKHHPKQPWIIHGFNGTTDEVRQLTAKGIYLSVGESLFYPNRKITQSISSIPLEYLFLETDTSPKTIQEIYEKASELLNIPLDQLKEQIFANFARLNLTPWKTGNNVPDCSSATMALINLDEAMC